LLGVGRVESTDSFLLVIFEECLVKYRCLENGRLERTMSESNVASDWLKMLWKLVKCWELLLDIKQWEEHKFSVGFPSLKTV
jgi:hypothetical protein